MTTTTTSTVSATWALAWMLIIDRGDGDPSAKIYPQKDDALAELRERYDPDGDFADAGTTDFLLIASIDWNLHIQLFPIRISVDRYQQIVANDWEALRNWEAEMDNA